MYEILSPADRLAIHEVIARYAWSLDTGDVGEFAACFLTEGVLRWEAFAQPVEWRGTAALRAFCEYFRALPSSAGRQHHVSNLRIDTVDDEVRARSYVSVVLRQDVAPHPITVVGYYDDRLVRHTDGSWRLRQRVIRDWAGPVLAAFAGQDGKAVARPRPAALDALFATGTPG
jgi:SnoaL-like domain